MRPEEKYFNLGIVLGLNLSLEENFKRILSILKSDCIAAHDSVIIVSEDIDLINELLNKQREILFELSSDENIKTNIEVLNELYTGKIERKT